MTFHWVNGVTVSAQYHSIWHFIAVPHTQHQLSLIWVKTGSLLMINPPPPLTSRNEIADTALYLHLSMSCHSWRSNRPRFHPWQLPASSGNRWVQHSGMDVWFPAKIVSICGRKSMPQLWVAHNSSTRLKWWRVPKRPASSHSAIYSRRQWASISYVRGTGVSQTGRA